MFCIDLSPSYVVQLGQEHILQLVESELLTQLRKTSVVFSLFDLKHDSSFPFSEQIKRGLGNFNGIERRFPNEETRKLPFRKVIVKLDTNGRPEVEARQGV